MTRGPHGEPGRTGRLVPLTVERPGSARVAVLGGSRYMMDCPEANAELVDLGGHWSSAIMRSAHSGGS
jgi:hypothetical protein